VHRLVESAPYVFSSFSPARYRLAMDDKLTPATATRRRNLPLVGADERLKPGENQADEVTAKIVAERLVAHLKRSGFVIMRKPIPVGHP
jgi:hypothetical protein